MSATIAAMTTVRAWSALSRCGRCDSSGADWFLRVHVGHVFFNELCDDVQRRRVEVGVALAVCPVVLRRRDAALEALLLDRRHITAELLAVVLPQSEHEPVRRRAARNGVRRVQPVEQPPRPRRLAKGERAEVSGRGQDVFDGVRQRVLERPLCDGFPVDELRPRIRRLALNKLLVDVWVELFQLLNHDARARRRAVRVLAVLHLLARLLELAHFDRALTGEFAAHQEAHVFRRVAVGAHVRRTARGRSGDDTEEGLDVRLEPT
mmetsp:Transcript_1997/g.6008  ORF Transcript_1997/g.6008 Transcript_1997/m.6008 type:complete len:264 (-) Transcript_1997:514-1305(-)